MQEQSLEEHLSELRQRVLISLAGTGAVALLVGVLLGGRIINLLTTAVLPEGTEVIAKTPTEYLYAWFLVVVLVSLYLSTPLVLHQLFRFIEPGLYPEEKRIFLRVVPISYLLFSAGIVVSVTLLLPAAASFLVSYTEPWAVPMLSVSSVVYFAVFIIAVTSLVFQTPVVVAFLLAGRLVSLEKLRSLRRYIYSIFFVLALLTAPSPPLVPALLVTLVLILLYEASLLLGSKLLR
ncbi:MAG: twin-arginine translocase subunit TatC [Euryarchaeota archaeon]|nr:twin-arginine translocase subunit TatC [Euryarchaeota archaeon]